jgi:lysozyme family protein
MTTGGYTTWYLNNELNMYKQNEYKALCDFTQYGNNWKNHVMKVLTAWMSKIA